MPDEPASRDELTRRIDTTLAAFERAIAAVPPHSLNAPLPGSTWSTRDIVAHIGADFRWFSAQMEALVEGRVPTPTECYGDDKPPGRAYDMSTPDGRNAWQHSRLAEMPFDDALQQMRVYGARVRDVVHRIPEADFRAPFAIVMVSHCGQVRRAQEGEVGAPLWRWFMGSTWHHLTEHAAQIEAFSRSVAPNN